MKIEAFRDLIGETIFAPRSAAARLIGLRLDRDVLWQVLLLTVALNALVFGIGNLISPPVQPLPPMMATPYMFALTLASGLVVTVFGVYWVGAWLGGQGGLSDLLVLIAWLQVLRLLVQVAATVLVLVLPGLALLLLMAASLMGIWIFINFIDVAHRYDSLTKAFGVLALTVVGIVAGLLLMLSIIGATSTGFIPDV